MEHRRQHLGDIASEGTGTGNNKRVATHASTSTRQLHPTSNIGKHKRFKDNPSDAVENIVETASSAPPHHSQHLQLPDLIHTDAHSSDQGTQITLNTNTQNNSDSLSVVPVHSPHSHLHTDDSLNVSSKNDLGLARSMSPPKSTHAHTEHDISVSIPPYAHAQGHVHTHTHARDNSVYMSPDDFSSLHATPQPQAALDNHSVHSLSTTNVLSEPRSPSHKDDNIAHSQQNLTQPSQTHTHVSSTPLITTMRTNRNYIQREETHPSLLSWQWTSERRAKLAAEGVYYKLGYFTAFEDDIIKLNVLQFAEENNDTPENLIWTKGRTRKDFWREVCRGLQRPLRFVAKHTKVLFPQSHLTSGYFSKDEDERLLHLKSLKMDWVSIANEMGRATDSVRHRIEYLMELENKSLLKPTSTLTSAAKSTPTSTPVPTPTLPSSTTSTSTTIPTLVTTSSPSMLNISSQSNEENNKQQLSHRQSSKHTIETDDNSVTDNSSHHALPAPGALPTELVTTQTEQLKTQSDPAEDTTATNENALVVADSSIFTGGDQHNNGTQNGNAILPLRLPALPKKNPKRIIVARRVWTEEEDIRLMESVMKVTNSATNADIVFKEIPWKSVKNLMINRTSKQCQNRWPILAFATAQFNDEGKMTSRKKLASGNSTESRIGISKQICTILKREDFLDESEVNWTKVGIEMGRHGKFIRTRFRFLRDLVPNNKTKELPEIIEDILNQVIPDMENKHKSSPTSFIVPADEMQTRLEILPSGGDIGSKVSNDAIANTNSLSSSPSIPTSLSTSTSTQALPMPAQAHPPLSPPSHTLALDAMLESQMASHAPHTTNTQQTSQKLHTTHKNRLLSPGVPSVGSSVPHIEPLVSIKSKTNEDEDEETEPDSE
eukprot:CFRG4632T1